MVEISRAPIPVVVITQAMVPATAQAIPTVSVDRAPFSSASKNLWMLILVSLDSMLTAMAEAVATIAARLSVVLTIMMTMMISGRRRYPLRMISFPNWGS